MEHFSLPLGGYTKHINVSLHFNFFSVNTRQEIAKIAKLYSQQFPQQFCVITLSIFFTCNLFDQFHSFSLLTGRVHCDDALTGMASIDSSAPETTSDSSPTLSRRPLRGNWATTSWGRGQDSDSISSSSSDSLGSSSSSGSRRAGGGARAKSTDSSR